MINYTERIALLMQDIVERTPRLSFIDLKEVLVFARFGRTEAEGAFATCHCMTIPESEPGYYYWRDRATGELTRRSEWFITKSPEVRVGLTRVKYLISFVLPRFCDQSLERSRKSALYPGAAPWLAKLDTIVHELYHIDPDESGIRRVARADGTNSPRSHGPMFYEDVAEMVTRYLASNPSPALYDFLKHDFDTLNAKEGGVVSTTFSNFPSFPQRYMQAVDMPMPDAAVKVERLKPLTQPVRYTEDDLHIRQFTDSSTRRLTRKGRYCAA
ncbi:MAG: hypothetical protein A3H96_17430 [Acidobacteria bacterium RIFCSPLOWO2_02_FULL_67_36]|nr:MAG: hypothetical protein A3H96_17430 [Acidobacteria bacterium RIFCSPLOWO2_02_FULL_67_36]OFW25797.1 MAG: hypothetical protein A3G21_25315 [Acidobacteria bacterium RIFCSPLOWO2_12_FULL_66_21]